MEIGPTHLLSDYASAAKATRDKAIKVFNLKPKTQFSSDQEEEFRAYMDQMLTSERWNKTLETAKNNSGLTDEKIAELLGICREIAYAYTDSSFLREAAFNFKHEDMARYHQPLYGSQANRETFLDLYTSLLMNNGEQRLKEQGLDASSAHVLNGVLIAHSVNFAEARVNDPKNVKFRPELGSAKNKTEDELNQRIVEIQRQPDTLAKTMQYKIQKAKCSGSLRYP